MLTEQIHNAPPMSAGHTRTSERQQMAAAHRRKAQMKAHIRAVIAVALLVTWSLAALTGFLLYFAPDGPRSGQMLMLLLTKAQWGDIHFWVSVAATMLTGAHIAVDWRALKGCLRHLVSGAQAQAARSSS